MPKKLLAIDANSLLHHHASSRALSRHAYHDHDGSPGRCHPTWNFKLALKHWSVRRHLESGSVDISIELQKMRPMTRRSWGSKSPLGNRSRRELQFSKKKKDWFFSRHLPWSESRVDQTFWLRRFSELWYKSLRSCWCRSRLWWTWQNSPSW